MAAEESRDEYDERMDEPIGAFALSRRQIEVLLKSVVTSMRMLRIGLEKEGTVTVETDDPDTSPRDAIKHDLEVLEAIGEGIVFMCQSLGVLDVGNIDDEVARAEMQQALSSLEKAPAITPEMINRFFKDRNEKETDTDD